MMVLKTLWIELFKVQTQNHVFGWHENKKIVKLQKLQTILQSTKQNKLSWLFKKNFK